jgi:hypothetical protein
LKKARCSPNPIAGLIAISSRFYLFTGFFGLPGGLTGGTHSIKTVASAFDAELDYNSLSGLSVGQEASEAFFRLATEQLAEGEICDSLRTKLLNYY